MELCEVYVIQPWADGFRCVLRSEPSGMALSFALKEV